MFLSSAASVGLALGDLLVAVGFASPGYNAARGGSVQPARVCCQCRSRSQTRSIARRPSREPKRTTASTAAARTRRRRRAGHNTRRKTFLVITRAPRLSIGGMVPVWPARMAPSPAAANSHYGAIYDLGKL